MKSKYRVTPKSDKQWWGMKKYVDKSWVLQKAARRKAILEKYNKNRMATHTSSAFEEAAVDCIKRLREAKKRRNEYLKWKKYHNRLIDLGFFR